MSTGTRISTAKGVRQIDGSSGLHVDPHPNDRGFSPSGLAAPLDATESPLNGAFTVGGPGLYIVSGSTSTTGTIPAASTHPGGMLMFTRDLNGSGPFMLTGSARATGAAGVFAINQAISGTHPGVALGDNMTVSNGQGGVCLWSDGRQWIPLASSGSLTIS